MFKTIISILLLGLLLSKADALLGQEDRVRFIGLESGINFHICESTNYDFIRGNVDVSTYGINEDVNNLSMTFQKWNVGAMSEFRFKRNKVGLLCGLRFSQVNSTLSKSTDYSSNLNFFYLLNKQEGTTTEFLKVKEINQYSNYVGVPIELKYFLFHILGLRFYAKGAAEFSYRLKTNTNVMFYNSEMEPYEQEVIEKFKEPNDFLVMLYGAGGVKIGKDTKTSLSLEIILPSLFLTDNNSGLVSPLTGSGFQLNIQIPF